MFVQLAYPWRGNRPDTIVEVGEATGRQLLKDGLARPAPSPNPRPRTRSTRAPQRPTSPEPPAEAGPQKEGD